MPPCLHDTKREEIHRAALRLANIYYLRFGRVPALVKEIAQATADNKAERERVPAGSFDGGEFLPGGGDKHPNRTSLENSQTAAIKRRAEAIYGETSGLTPKLINTQKNPYNPSNWEKHSTQKLKQARTYIGIISERNPRVRRASPVDPKNPIQSQAW